MIRARFEVEAEDYRPINWPIKHPYWCTGSGGDYWIIVAYADGIEDIILNWPEAKNIEATEETDYSFSDRFPKPAWFNLIHTENAKG